MKAIGVCITGLEDVAIKEVKEISNLPASVKMPGRIVIEYEREEDIKKIVYLARSMNKVYLLLKEFSFKSNADFKKNIKDLKVKREGKSFAVRCSRKGNQKFNSQWVEKEIGAMIAKKVDLENPDIVVYADVIDNLCLIGIDMGHVNLCKRNYRIRAVNDSINSCLAYCLIRSGGFEGQGTLLDPFCKDGSVAIEATLFATNTPNGFPIKEKLKLGKFDFRAFDKKIIKKKARIICSDPLMHNVKCSEINAQVAGIRKEIKFARVDIEWLETKFKKQEVDFIITVLPSVSKTKNEDDVNKVCNEFFYQCEYILKKEGVIVVASRKKEIFEVAAAKYGFKLKERLCAKIGEDCYFICIYLKNFVSGKKLNKK